MKKRNVRRLPSTLCIYDADDATSTYRLRDAAQAMQRLRLPTSWTSFKDAVQRPLPPHDIAIVDARADEEIIAAARRSAAIVIADAPGDLAPPPGVHYAVFDRWRVAPAPPSALAWTMTPTMIDSVRALPERQPLTDAPVALIASQTLSDVVAESVRIAMQRASIAVIDPFERRWGSALTLTYPFETTLDRMLAIRNADIVIIDPSTPRHEAYTLIVETGVTGTATPFCFADHALPARSAAVVLSDDVQRNVDLLTMYVQYKEMRAAKARQLWARMRRDALLTPHRARQVWHRWTSLAETVWRSSPYRAVAA